MLYNTGVNKPLLDILTKDGYTNTTLLNKVRNSGYKSDYYKENKKALSAATFSSVQDDLTVNRSDNNHLFHTGFIAFDIDPDTNPMLLHGGDIELRDYIIDNIPYVCYLGRSVSNIGFWGLFAIQHKDEHYAHYLAMKKYFADKNITIDNTSDISRLRFIAFDPDAHFELNPEIFDLTVEKTDQPFINKYTRATPNNDFFIACCKWVEVKHDLKFQPGMIHNYLCSLYSTLRFAHVSREDCLNWIYRNLITEAEVTTNCLDEIDFNKKW